MSYNIGLNVLEVEGRAAPSVQGAATSIAAFIIRAPKGTPGQVEQIANWTQFVDKFGSFTEGMYGAYAVRGFFDNGGTLAYVACLAEGKSPGGDVLSCFDTYQVQLICCPESADQAWVAEAVGYCERRGDCIFVGHTAMDADLTAAKAFGVSCQGSKIYGALYFPWIQTRDPQGQPIWIPPTGHVLGVYARTERERGIWKAPAGNAARVAGALDVKYHITDVEHTDLVKNGSVNAVRYIPGQGIVIDSSRTLSTDARWLYVNVRLLFNYVKSSLKSSLRWVVQEPNDDSLWNKVKFNSIVPFLMGLWRRGAFGPGAPEEVFTVKCDAENNPPANIQQGIFTVEVYFYPSRPAETIIIEVGQQEGGGSAGER